MHLYLSDVAPLSFLISSRVIKDAAFETQTFLSKATYESFRGVTCEMPRSHDTDKAFTSYQVRVSNDGRLWSQPVPLFIFDGGCLKCTTRNMGCEIKVGKYKQHFSLKSEFLQTSTATSENFIFEKIKSLSLFRELLFRFKLSTT